jgi:hypothetical protein
LLTEFAPRHSTLLSKRICECNAQMLGCKS